MGGLHFHPLRVADVRRDGDEAAIVAFEQPAAELRGAFAFRPGQYLTLRAHVDGIELRRSYSICAAPGEPLRIGVRHVPGGAFSGWLHRQLEPGDVLESMEPQGRFGAALGDVGKTTVGDASQAGPAHAAPVGAGPRRHLLAVAGGSGITPVISVLKAALSSDPRCHATLVYGNRHIASTMFKEELEDLKNRHLARLALHLVFSREAVDSPLHTGRIDAHKLATLLRLGPPVDEAFVCGPHAMNDEVEAALLQLGLAPGQVHVERFGVPPEAVAAPPPSTADDAAQARIAIQRDGVTREVPFGPGDPSILAAAARAGLDVPYSCQSGVCATCRAKVLEGRARMDRNFALDADELAAGFVLTCQAHPLTERVALSFDHR
jgi:ring-1,2-phenylacetyl-CoA epoxidase subunit PaaE